MKVERDNVELLRAWEDGTWDVEAYDCPYDVGGEDAEALIMGWVNESLLPLTQYRKVVYWGVYAIHPNGLNPED